jgi:hypothetical protein
MITLNFVGFYLIFTDELPEWHEKVASNLKKQFDVFIASFTSAASVEIPIVQDYSL